MTPTLHGFGTYSGLGREGGFATGALAHGRRFAQGGESDSARASSAGILAGLLESAAAGEGEANPVLSRRVREEGLNLRAAYEALPESERARFARTFSPELLQEIFSLSQESDASLFYQGLHALGLRLSRSHRPELAMLFFSGIAQTLEQEFPGRPADHAALALRARRELDALMGRGAIAPRVEHLLRGVAQEASNPVMLASMGVAGFAFSTVRMGMLSRLLASSSGGAFTRGFGARALASTAGFVAEVPAFVFSGRGLNEALVHRQDWSWGAMGRDLATAGITLSALKLSGWGARSLMGRMEGSSALAGFSRAALPQAATLGGLMLGHRMEEGLGLRPHVDGATTFVDSLSTLLVFHVSGRLLHHAMGPNYAALQREMELRSHVMARMPRARGESGDRPPLADLLGGVFSAPRPLAAGVGAVEDRGPRPFRLPHIFMMENFDGNNGGNGGDGKPPSHRPRVTPPERLRPHRPSPTPIEQALKLASEAPEGQAKIHVTENPPAAERPVEVEEIAFDLAPEVPPGEALAAPKAPVLGEIRETMMSPVAPSPPAAIPARIGETAPTKTIVRIPVLIPGTRVGPEGRYEIRELLSQGANGTVYRVIDTRGGRSAAIKVPKHGNQPADLERFQREIWISENLASGWAVPIYDHFEIIKGSGIQVPLMEFVDGVTLGRVLHRVSYRDPETQVDYPLERRVDLFADLCLGVHDAHQHGVIHNDLKPDNLMVDRNVRMRILDWGLARHLGEKIAEGRMSLSPEALRHRPPRASASTMAGTPGYIAPEMTRLDRGPNERSQDIFSLGVILYEMATGLHPLGLYRPGDAARGEPRLVPIREGEHPQGQTKINPRSILLYGQDPSLNPPSFRDILTGTHPDYLYELESIARKAMDPDPARRFQNAAELREAVLMARARSDREALDHLRERMREAEALTKASWMRFNVASRIDPAHWTRMHQMIWSLRQDRESWHQGVEDLVTRLSEVMKYDRSSAARRMIAELSWERLVDGGDRMPRSVRRALARRIQANDFPLKPDGGPMFSSLLTGTTPLALRLSHLSDGELLNPELEGRARLRVLRIRRETDARGVELGTFREGETVAEGTLADWNQRLGLGAGYYVLELSAPGYAPMRVPLRVGYQDVQRGVVEGRFLDVPIEMVPEAELGPDMALVQGGRSFTGFDFYEDGMPSNVYSFPMHEIELPTFAISRKPVTVGEYLPFVEHLVAEGRIEEARSFMPRKNVPPQRISRDLFRDTWRVYREEGLRAAFEHFINRQRGNHYYWRLRPEGFGPWKRYRLTDPTEHLDPNGDPILKEQPISAISRLAAEAFLRWESERQGREYSLPTAEEKEKVDRNAFPWNFPWGYDFAPFYLISRLAFSGELKNSTYPQPVGKHVMDQSLYRDFSIYGTVDNLGNVREYTASHGEPGYVVLSGGSVRVPYGPFYYPASRNYAHRETAVDDSVGAFRRVQRFGRPQPRDLSPEAPPVR